MNIEVSTNPQAVPLPALFVGIDWADQKHDVYWIAVDGRHGQRVVEQSPEQIEELLTWLGELAGGGQPSPARLPSDPTQYPNPLTKNLRCLRG